MSINASRPLTVAIDSQVSANASGGTETALVSLLTALGGVSLPERFVLIGLKGHAEELTPFMGPGMERFIWPSTYRWFDPTSKKPEGMKPRWRRLQRALGPFGGLVPAVYRYYATETPLTPKAIGLANRVGPLKFAVPPAYRLYRGIRDEAARPMVAARADSILRGKGVDVVHFPYPLHFETRLPYVYEPWGLPHHHQPECFRPGEVQWMDELFGRGCRNASMIITATRWVKQDIVEKYRIDPARIAVIPRMPRVDHAHRFMDPAEALAGLPESFALFPSATWVTKNHIRLIRAIGHLRDDHGVRLDLVCTGRTNTPESGSITREIERLRLGDQVRFLGVVPVERLNTLYRSARFLVHPSIFEGLGLPLLEAFQHNCPVVASTAACVPEVVGDGALLFDPFDEQDIVRALLDVIRHPDKLDALRERGARRLADGFPPPDKMARMFETVYLRAAGRKLDPQQARLLSEMLA